MTVPKSNSIHRGLWSSRMASILAEVLSTIRSCIGCSQDSFRALTERLQPRLPPPQNQCVDVMGAFVGVHGFQVY